MSEYFLTFYPSDGEIIVQKKKDLIVGGKYLDEDDDTKKKLGIGEKVTSMFPVQDLSDDGTYINSNREFQGIVLFNATSKCRAVFSVEISKSLR